MLTLSFDESDPKRSSSGRVVTPWMSIVADGRAAIDRYRRSLDVTRGLRAQEQGKRSDILNLAEAADAAPAQCGGPKFLNRFTGRLRALSQSLLLPLGPSVAWMDHVDIDAVPHAELGKALGEVRNRGVDRATNQEFRLR